MTARPKVQRAIPLTSDSADPAVACGFHNSATSPDLGFYAVRSYSLRRPPRTGRRWIRS